MTHETRSEYPVADRVDGAAVLEPAPAAEEPIPAPVPIAVPVTPDREQAPEARRDADGTAGSTAPDARTDWTQTDSGAESAPDLETDSKLTDPTPDSTVADPTPDSSSESTELVPVDPDTGKADHDAEAAWRELQLRFVDDPQSAVADAADLIEQAVADLRRRLESTDSTEELRSAFLRYREVHQNLR